MTHTIGGYNIVRSIPVDRLIYVATHPETGGRVILKADDSTFFPELPGCSKQLLRYEARILGELDHPSICRPLGYIHGPSDFLVVSHAGDQTLADIDSLNKPALINVLAQVSAALVHAHDRDIIHRDVKPSNIAVRHDGTTIKATLIDWGASYREACRLPRIFPWGTSGYMSPEQIAEDIAYRWNDVFGFCVSAYQAITKKLPFANPTDSITQPTTSPARTETNTPTERTKSMGHEELRFSHPRFFLGAVADYGKLGELIIAGLSADPDLRPSMREIAGQAAAQFGLEACLS